MSTFEKVQQIVAKQLNRPVGDFSAETDLVEAGFESLDVIELMFALEEEFDISIEFSANDAEGSNMKTVGDIVRAVDAEIAKKPQGR